MNDSAQPLSAVQKGDIIYLLTNEGLISLSLSNSEIICITDAYTLSALDISMESLLFYDNNLMAFDVAKKQIWEYDQLKWKLAFEFEGKLPDNPDEVYDCPVYQNNMLFLRSVTGGDEARTWLHQINLSNGSAKSIAIEGLRQLANYKNNKILALQRLHLDENVAYAIVTIDTQSGDIKETITTLPNVGDGRIAYSQDNDEIYALVGGGLCVWRDDAWSNIRPVTASGDDFYFCIQGDYYVIVGYQGVRAIDLKQVKDIKTLTIQGIMTLADTDNGFMQEHPGWAISRATQMHYCAQEVFQAVQSGDTTDLFLIPLSASAVRLFRKGYAEPLESSFLIKDNQSLYPSAAEPLWQDGKLYAVALDIYADGWLMRTDRGGFEPPLTVQDLLEQHLKWSSQVNNNSIPWITTAFDMKAWTGKDYLSFLFTQYIMTVEHVDKPLNFSNEAFRALLQLLQSCYHELEDNSDYLSTDNEIASGVLAANYTIILAGQSNLSLIHPPVLFEGAAVNVPAKMYIYIINPLSENKEAAIAYLEYVSMHRDKHMQVLLNAQIDQGIYSPFYESLIMELSADISIAKQTAEEADDLLRAELNEQISLLEDKIRSLRETPECWSVYEPFLKEYTANIAPHLNFQLSPFLEDGRATHAPFYTDMYHILEQYISGHMSIDQCISQLNSIAAMVYAENAGEK